jgi:hypothetical protein
MTANPEITLKDYPDEINEMILDKQTEQKKIKCSCNKSQAVILLLKELIRLKNRK